MIQLKKEEEIGSTGYAQYVKKKAEHKEEIYLRLIQLLQYQQQPQKHN